MQCSVFCATSLDGYIARADDGLDWLPTDPEPHGYDEFIATIDAIVMGRKTFDVVLAFGSWLYGTTPVIVLTSRPDAVARPAGAVVEGMSGTPGEIVARLEQRGMRHLYINGGITIQRFVAAGLIQRMTITQIPVLLGTGIPLFGPVPHDIRLRPVATRSYPSGLVQTEYEVLA